MELCINIARVISVLYNCVLLCTYKLEIISGGVAANERIIFPNAYTKDR